MCLERNSLSRLLCLSTTAPMGEQNLDQYMKKQRRKSDMFLDRNTLRRLLCLSATAPANQDPADAIAIEMRKLEVKAYEAK